MDNETFFDIPDYTGFYKISKSGVVKSLDKYTVNKGFRALIKGRTLRQGVGSHGYKVVTLNRKTTLLHRLLAEMFILNPENKRTVNHINGIKTDNRLENLEWMTYSENVQHAVDTGMNVTVRGEEHSKTLLTTEQVLKIREMYASATKISQYKLADMFNVTRSCINSITNNRTWKHI